MTDNKSQNHKGSPLFRNIVVGTILAVVMLLVAVVAMVAMAGTTIINQKNSQDCGVEDMIGGAVSAISDELNVPKKLHEQQLKNAKTIDAVAQELGLSGQASKVAITAAFGESTLINLNFGDEDKGVTNPNGSPTDSKGLFQQQPSQGWGSIKEVTDPATAARSFFLGHGGNKGLVDIPGWETGEISPIINKVQHNSDPNHYVESYEPANKIIEEAGIDTSRPADDAKRKDHKAQGAAASSAGSQGDQGASSGCAAGGKSGKAGKPGKAGDGKNTYPWDHLAPPPNVYNVDPLGFFYGECTSYASWKVNEAMGGTADKIIFNNSYGGHQKGNGAEWKSAWEASGWKVSNTPVAGSVAWWNAGGGEGIGSAGHVAWVDEVTQDGKVVISEYNNSFYAPPGHKFNVRPKEIDAGQVNAYLYVPEKK